MAAESVSSTPTEAPYGTWKSPISSAAIVAGLVRLSEVSVDGDNVYWLEGRPTEAGRYALVRHSIATGATADVLPGAATTVPHDEGSPDGPSGPYNARSRVHEYGGGAYLARGDTVLFSHFYNQRLFSAGPDGVSPLTPETSAKYRFADYTVDNKRGVLYAVQEYHPSEKPSEVVNTIVAIPLGGSKLGDDGLIAGHTVIASGADFYSCPQLSPDGSKLAYVSWNHPNMPWDSTSLHVATLSADGAVASTEAVVAAEEGKEGESVVQPQWSPDGTLFFISDRSNWWNLYRVVDGEIQAVCPKEAEFGGPGWMFRYKYYDFLSADELVVSYPEEGFTKLAVLTASTGALRELPTGGCTALASVRADAKGENVFFLGGSPTQPSAVMRLELASGAVTVLKSSMSGGAAGADESKGEGAEESKGEGGAGFDLAYFSAPTQVAFDAKDGQKSYAFFYAPTNKDFVAPADERPPVLVKLHGGPTSSTRTTFRLDIQYWTSRGFAVLDVNYGGSTGYGRKYRNRLRGEWGNVDVDDCCSAALAMVEAGKVDGKRLAVTGGSAGGFTVLAALTRRSVFSAGASHYGVSDLGALAEETHKFESKYLDLLVGKWPEDKAIYDARSPNEHTDGLSVPVVFFQGTEDKIVPPNQATTMFEVVKSKGLPTALVMFEGEQHGFRKSENVRHALDGEFAFYGHCFGFEPADKDVLPEPLDIVNPLTGAADAE